MSEHEIKTGSPTEEDYSFPDVEELDDDDLQAYADWADEQSSTEIEPYPHQLELSEAMQQRKSELDTQIDKMLVRLASEEVRSKGHYNAGGEAEVASEMRKLQLQELPGIYADTRYESDFLAWHARQETEDWCQLASLENAFKALGDTSVTQGSIAQELNIHPGSRPFPDNLVSFVRNKGLDASKMDSVTGMIDALVDGGKIILHTGYPAVAIQHAVLVSGVRIDHGTIEFLYNDSAMDEGIKTLPLSRMLELLEPPFAHNAINRSYAVSRSKPATSYQTKNADR